MHLGELLIDGHFVGGPYDTSVEKRVVKSPWDGTIVGTAAEGGCSEWNACLDSARNAFEANRLSIAKRKELLNRVASLVSERTEELAWLAVAEIGKPISAARAEVSRTAITFRAAADALDKWDVCPVDISLDPRHAIYACHATRAPYGVVVAIVPYNWPFNLAAHKIAPALAAGNAVVLKGSEKASLCSLALARIVHEAGCPPGIVNAFSGDVRVVAAGLADPRIDKISFTGSEAVGWQMASDHPRKHISLELGGNGFVIVCDDADILFASERIAWGGYLYAGQICISVQTVLAQRHVIDALRSALMAECLRFPIGDPRDERVLCGPLISAEATDIAAFRIQQAEDLGASIRVPARREGNLLWPVLIEDVPEQADLYHEEAFAPIVCLEPFDQLTDAIERVNSSRFGLQAGVFSNNPDLLSSLAEALRVGGVVLNDVPTVRFDAMPYGGFRHSGLGREGGIHGLEAMSQWKAIVTRTDRV